MLYHISEDANIKEFIPRKSEIYKELAPVVWAIDEEHIIYYYFPRDCPRIIYKFSSDITEEDTIKFFSNTVSNTIITIENRWYEIINKTILYKYIFDTDKFRLLDNTPGYYISEEKNEPKSVEKIDNIIKVLTDQDIELRFTPNIFPLRNSLIKSSIKYFSIIRFRNAKE
jgi:hypothetical protein